MCHSGCSKGPSQEEEIPHFVRDDICFLYKLSIHTIDITACPIALGVEGYRQATGDRIPTSDWR